MRDVLIVILLLCPILHPRIAAASIKIEVKEHNDKGFEVVETFSPKMPLTPGVSFEPTLEECEKLSVDIATPCREDSRIIVLANGQAVRVRVVYGDANHNAPAGEVVANSMLKGFFRGLASGLVNGLFGGR